LHGLTAPAGAVALVDGQSLTVTSGGISATFTVAGCTLDAAVCGSSTGQLVQDPGKLGVLIESASGGNLANSPDDLTFGLNVTSTSLISGLTLGMTGAGAFTSVGEEFDNGAPSLSVSPGGVLTDTTVFPTPTTTFTGTKDIQPLSLFGETAYVTTVTQDLVVPEPASTGLLAVGVGLLALLRRRRTA